MVSNISGVILAGGSNTRFNGITKANIVIDGKTIISRIIETISDIFGEIIIVTNTPEEFSAHSNYKIVSDQFLNAGPLGGIHAALKASSGEAIFVFAGDMPLLDKELIIRQIYFYELIKCEILVPRTGKQIEPLHSIYNSSVIIKLEEYLGGGNTFAVRDFFKLADVGYLDLEESERVRLTFTNINSSSDISVVKDLLRID